MQYDILDRRSFHLIRGLLHQLNSKTLEQINDVQLGK